MDLKWRADIVVGIDFGMTCTGLSKALSVSRIADVLNRTCVVQRTRVARAKDDPALAWQTWS